MIMKVELMEMNGYHSIVMVDQLNILSLLQFDQQSEELKVLEKKDLNDL